MKRHALIIGINDYKNGIPALKYARKDSQKLCTALKLDAAELLLDYDAQETIQTIRTLMEDLEAGDLFIFYFSGHGCELQGKQYLLGPDADSTLLDTHYGMMPMDVINRLSRKAGVQRLFILDCCRNNPFDGAKAVKAVSGAKGMAMESLVTQDKKESIIPPVILYSCADGQCSYEDHRHAQGFFTGALLKSIKNREVRNFRAFQEDIQRNMDAVSALIPGNQEIQWYGNLTREIMLLPDWEIQLEKPCSSDPETGENTDQSDPETLLAEAQQLLQDSNTAEAAEKAVELLQSAGDHAPALNLLGDLYFHGKRIARDLSAALHCYRTSAESGDAFGQYMYAICCEEGYALAAPDFKEAARYYLLAADQGLPRAQHLFAALCAIGKGIECDKKRSFEYFRKAATQGYHRSECSLGYCYSYGIGVQPDPQQAVMWYRRAVEHGNIRAMKNLAACYAEGHGVSADPVMAEKYRKMAEEAELAEMKKKALQQQAANRTGNF